MQYILTDIEGTTTSVSFVYDTLFPYFTKHFAGFYTRHYPHYGLAEQLEAVMQTVREEENKIIGPIEAVDQLLAWTAADRKHPALKALQGSVWRAAYEAGEIQGHIYDDVLPALQRWQNAGYGLGIYSSGSVEAQQLLFGHSVFGDLRPFFAHYFDTKVGHKREAASYRNIEAALGIPAADILFLSDVEAELDAAAEAGFQTIQLVRPGNQAGTRHRVVADFSEITI